MASQRTALATTTIALLVIIVVLVGAMGGVLLTSQSVTHTVTSTSTQTTTVSTTSIQTTTVTTGSKTSQTNITTASCTSSGPTVGVAIRVLTNATSPLVGANVSGQDIWYCNGSPQISQLQPETTNSTGWASLRDGGNGIYYLNISYSYIDLGQNYTNHYTLSIPTVPIALTSVTFYYESGNVTTHIHYYA